MLFWFTALTTVASASRAKPLFDKPKLIVLIVVDQLRSDQLTQNMALFKKGGFKKLMEEGSYIPFAEYPLLQNLTCPGHALIVSGSTPAHNKIPLNEWFSFSEKKVIPCTFDPQHGHSPKNFLGSTIGDELRLNNSKAKVVSLALKDRSAIMLGGHSALAAYWFHVDKNLWVTSSYYQNVPLHLREVRRPMIPEKNTELPFEPQQLRKALPKKAFDASKSFNRTLKWGTKDGLSHPIAGKAVFDFAEFLIEQYELGTDEVTDFLALSLSNHDYGGHLFGPHAPETLEILLNEDEQLAGFLKGLKKRIGEKSFWVILTADHGVAPLVETALTVQIPAGRIDLKSAINVVEDQLKKKLALSRKLDPFNTDAYLFKS
ncbi:MAG: alkaline phosphatase family protein [Pseudobdellovibrionaceae bacterium]|nr:alkaline phosphatase family protein [Pseudobdellovibrionaceae bacterium]